MRSGDSKKASDLIGTCEAVGMSLLSLLVSEPTLRAGACSSCFEEYAEAVLFSHWVQTGFVYVTFVAHSRPRFPVGE